MHSYLFINVIMKKTKRVIVRVTEDQFKRLTDQIIIEEETKSQFLRKLILKELGWISSLNLSVPSNNIKSTPILLNRLEGTVSTVTTTCSTWVKMRSQIFGKKFQKFSNTKSISILWVKIVQHCWMVLTPIIIILLLYPGRADTPPTCMGIRTPPPRRGVVNFNVQ